ncbi:RPM1-interacting protein 4 isoform X1 [Populus alba]|uniref:RPM1-interacting protein 4 isoform X1 n=1 Tax=Populus alba TaxID=43335 RepID=UPI00158C52EA|nr:RPM1-interacting protein 4-like isoform X1 [Populus alba]
MILSQQRHHVPKFGGWDNDNVPYTAYFDTARKEKSGRRMNPNDPEENPEAFMHARGVMEDDVDFSSGAYQGITAEHHNIDLRLKGHNAHGTRSSNDHQKSASHKSITSESGSEKSSSEGNKALSSSRHSRQRSRSTHSTNHDGHQRAASIPKFGAWDDTDPKSGEGFTVVFNRVKEEKQIASKTFPSVPIQPVNRQITSQRNQGSSSSLSKFCCCFFPRGN